MNKLTPILNRIEKARPESERSLVQQYIKELAQCCAEKDKQILHGTAENLPDNLQLWASVKKFLDGLIVNPPQFDLIPAHLREDIFETLRKFSKIANRRAQEINRISPHVMNPKAEQLYFKVSKISFNELKERLQKLWINFRNKNIPQLNITDELLGIKFSSPYTLTLLETIKNIHFILTLIDPNINPKDIWATKTLPTFSKKLNYVNSGHLTSFRIRLEVLEAMAYAHHQIQNQLTPLTNIELFPFHDFVHCSKCWRLVPRFQDSDKPNNPDKKYQKNLKAFYCDEHSPIECAGHTLTEYHKAIKLPCNNKKEGVEPATAQKTFELMRYFPSVAPDDPAGLSAQEWYEAKVCPLYRLNISKYPRIIFDLNRIWELCPNVLRYILEKGGDPNSPEAILEILDPFTRKEEAEEKELRIKLHKLLAKNFGLYFQELAMAETFLSEYNQQWDGRTHGGNRRKNSK